MSAPDSPFKTISIVGLGLIGGSIALAIRERVARLRYLHTDGVVGQADAYRLS